MTPPYRWRVFLSANTNFSYWGNQAASLVSVAALVSVDSVAGLSGL